MQVVSAHDMITINAGNPHIVIDTGNTTLDITTMMNTSAPDDIHATLLPPFTIPDDIFANVGPFSDGVAEAVATTNLPVDTVPSTIVDSYTSQTETGMMTGKLFSRVFEWKFAYRVYKTMRTYMGHLISVCNHCDYCSHIIISTAG
jgi:hypothetical protein